MSIRFVMAAVIGIVGTTVAPWAWLAGAFAVAMPMALGIWLVARLTTSPIVVNTAGTARPAERRRAPNSSQ